MAETEFAPIETPEQSRAYFAKQTVELSEFWSRFGGPPAYAGAKVLDVGSGHGAGSIEAAQAGAKQVLGVDLDADRVTFAKANLAEKFPELASTVTFEPIDVGDVQGEWDVIVSKDTFEHVQELEPLLIALRERLSDTGQIWVGFAPLWASPRGDHGRTGLKIWWAHAILPKRWVLRSATRHRGYPVRDWSDIGLNGRAPQEYVDAFNAAGLKVDWLEYNQSTKRSVRILKKARTLGPLERFATVGIYAKLSKR